MHFGSGKIRREEKVDSQFLLVLESSENLFSLNLVFWSLGEMSRFDNLLSSVI